MSAFRGRTAVMTAGASGIGHGVATRFDSEGMNPGIADIEDSALVSARRSYSTDRRWRTCLDLGDLSD